MSLPLGFRYLRNMALYTFKSVKQAYKDDYGEDLKCRYDRADKTLCRERIFCLDCLDYETCRGRLWKGCSYKVRALKIIKEEL